MGLKCRDILTELFKLAPEFLAEDWDNVGLLTGRPEKEVHRLYLALDATDDCIEHAVKTKADMLLTHHPMIFKALKKVTGDDFTGRRVMELISHDISYAAMHTNYDRACMAEKAAERLDLKEKETFCMEKTDDSGRDYGLGVIGTLSSPLTLAGLAEEVKLKFRIPDVRIYGDEAALVERAAIIPGSGGGEAGYVLEKDADVFITGDISHHQGLDAVLQGLFVIDAGHYGIEKIFISDMEKWFRGRFPDLKVYTEEIREPFVTR